MSFQSLHLQRPDEFELIRLLGQGDVGRVYLTVRRSDRAPFAVKVLWRNDVIPRGKTQRVLTEYEVLTTVRHPSLLRLELATQTRSKLYFFLEFCVGGELFFFAQRSRGRSLSLRHALFVAAEVLCGLRALHAAGFVYRDLKPENIMLTSEGHVRIGDFDLAKRLPGDPPYQPPLPGTDPTARPPQPPARPSPTPKNFAAPGDIYARGPVSPPVPDADASVPPPPTPVPASLHTDSPSLAAQLGVLAAAAARDEAACRCDAAVPGQRGGRFPPHGAWSSEPGTAPNLGRLYGQTAAPPATCVLAQTGRHAHSRPTSEPSAAIRDEAPTSPDPASSRTPCADPGNDVPAILLRGKKISRKTSLGNPDSFLNDVERDRSMHLMQCVEPSTTTCASVAGTLPMSQMSLGTESQTGTGTAASVVGGTGLMSCLGGPSEVLSAASSTVSPSLADAPACSAATLSSRGGAADSTPILAAAPACITDRDNVSAAVWNAGGSTALQGTGGASVMKRARFFSLVGTYEYMAPELIRRTGHGEAVDYWAFGILLHEMIYGFTPFRSSTPSAAVRTVLAFAGSGRRFAAAERTPIGRAVPHAVRDLIDRLLVADPERRLGCGPAGRRWAEVAAHPAFAEMDWAKVDRHEMAPPVAFPVSFKLDTVHFRSAVAAQRMSRDVPVDVLSEEPLSEASAPAAACNELRQFQHWDAAVGPVALDVMFSDPVLAASRRDPCTADSGFDPASGTRTSPAPGERTVPSVSWSVLSGDGRVTDPSSGGGSMVRGGSGVTASSVASVVPTPAAARAVPPASVLVPRPRTSVRRPMPAPSQRVHGESFDRSMRHVVRVTT
eukprot:TRINITY_DN4232_c0_g1_i1.p1 TRINITY_DN4232_c0_g1~~TRINITY_DN4232_c0_g1_i1.p1  ORF type:complete len:838 (-),score=110.92 TRINITY_DN4232_c0_g1_i1:1264-3777(-)